MLDGLDLAVPAATITAVLGASGSGKTTLLRVIAGLERVDAGRVSVAGRVVDDGRRVIDARHRGVGYVPQDAALFPHLTVRANIAFGVRRAKPAVADRLLELIGLAGFGDRHPHQLSGGQQQRVALARALAIRPALVLLDEPFAALDAALRVDLRRDVAHVLARTETAAVLVTHDQDEALALADAVALLDGGRIIAHGEPAELYRRPPSAAAGAALGSANLLAADVTGRSARCVLGEVAARPDALVQRRRAPAAPARAAPADDRWAGRAGTHRPGRAPRLRRARRTRGRGCRAAARSDLQRRRARHRRERCASRSTAPRALGRSSATRRLRVTDRPPRHPWR